VAQLFLVRQPQRVRSLLLTNRVVGIRRLPDAKLFFPEEYPDVIAEEATRLWGG